MNDLGNGPSRPLDVIRYDSSFPSLSKGNLASSDAGASGEATFESMIESSVLDELVAEGDKGHNPAETSDKPGPDVAQGAEDSATEVLNPYRVRLDDEIGEDDFEGFQLPPLPGKCQVHISLPDAETERDILPDVNVKEDPQFVGGLKDMRERFDASLSVQLQLRMTQLEAQLDCIHPTEDMLEEIEYCVDREIGDQSLAISPRAPLHKKNGKCRSSPRLLTGHSHKPVGSGLGKGGWGYLDRDMSFISDPNNPVDHVGNSYVAVPFSSVGKNSVKIHGADGVRQGVSGFAYHTQKTEKTTDMSLRIREISNHLAYRSLQIKSFRRSLVPFSLSYSEPSPTTYFNYQNGSRLQLNKQLQQEKEYASKYKAVSHTINSNVSNTVSNRPIQGRLKKAHLISQRLQMKRAKRVRRREEFAENTSMANLAASISGSSAPPNDAYDSEYGAGSFGMPGIDKFRHTQIHHSQLFLHDRNKPESKEILAGDFRNLGPGSYGLYERDHFNRLRVTLPVTEPPRKFDLAMNPDRLDNPGPTAYIPRSPKKHIPGINMLLQSAREAITGDQKTGSQVQSARMHRSNQAIGGRSFTFSRTARFVTKKPTLSQTTQPVDTSAFNHEAPHHEVYLGRDPNTYKDIMPASTDTKNVSDKKFHLLNMDIPTHEDLEELRAERANKAREKEERIKDLAGRMEEERFKQRLKELGDKEKILKDRKEARSVQARWLTICVHSQVACIWQKNIHHMVILRLARAVRERSARRIQKAWKKYCSRQKKLRRLRSLMIIQRSIKMFILKRRGQSKRKAAEIISHFFSAIMERNDGKLYRKTSNLHVGEIGVRDLIRRFCQHVLTIQRRWRSWARRRNLQVEIIYALWEKELNNQRAAFGSPFTHRTFNRTGTSKPSTPDVFMRKDRKYMGSRGYSRGNANFGSLEEPGQLNNLTIKIVEMGDITSSNGHENLLGSKFGSKGTNGEEANGSPKKKKRNGIDPLLHGHVALDQYYMKRLTAEDKKAIIIKDLSNRRKDFVKECMEWQEKMNAYVEDHTKGMYAAKALLKGGGENQKESKVKRKEEFKAMNPPPRFGSIPSRAHLVSLINSAAKDPGEEKHDRGPAYAAEGSIMHHSSGSQGKGFDPSPLARPPSDGSSTSSSRRDSLS